MQMLMYQAQTTSLNASTLQRLQETPLMPLEIALAWLIFILVQGVESVLGISCSWLHERCKVLLLCFFDDESLCSLDIDDRIHDNKAI